MLIAGIDFETTSVDPQTCYPTEFALILWDSNHEKIIETMSFLLDVPEDIEITNEHITGISRNLLFDNAFKWTDVQEHIYARLHAADYLMAHNIEFDRTILHRFLQTEEKFDWIDTMTDIPYPPQIRTRALSYLAAEHGFINPFPHRALFDVMTMIKILGMYDFDTVMEYANSPNLWIRATVSIDDRQLAKDRYFRWDPVNKLWVKQIKELNLEYEEERADFPIDLLPGYEYKEQYV